MSDLISRKEVLGIITPRLNSSKIGSLEYQRLYSVLESVRQMPTAYDLESVIGQVENIKTDNSCTDCKYKEKCDELQEIYNPSDDVDLCALVTKHLALDIIKSATNGG